MGGKGPGVAHPLSGVANPWIKRVPVIVIGTQRTSRGVRAIRRNRFQHTPQLDLIRPVSKFAAAISGDKASARVLPA